MNEGYRHRPDGYAAQVGGQIADAAHDDAGVAAVHVALSTEDGGAIETGSAVESPLGSGRRVCAATMAAPQGTRAGA